MTTYEKLSIMIQLSMLLIELFRFSITNEIA